MNWRRFFVLAGIDRAFIDEYVQSFEENRITFDMLKDLDKQSLADLGVSAVGDQILILRRIRTSSGGIKAAASHATPRVNAQSGRNRVVAPADDDDDVMIEEDYSLASTHRRGRPPPDRNEIYHVKMPDGNTARSRKILNRAKNLRNQGLSVRGTTGVRQGGRSVSPIDKTSLAARNRNQREQFEIVTRPDPLLGRLGVRGLHSDAGSAPAKRVLTGRIQKRTVITTTQPMRGRVTGGAMFSRAMDSLSQEDEYEDDEEIAEEEIVFPSNGRGRVTTSGAVRTVETKSGMPRVTLNLGPRASASHSSITGGGGARGSVHQRLQGGKLAGKGVASRLSGGGKPLAARLQGRRQFGGAGSSRMQVLQADEVMDDDYGYEDEGDVYELGEGGDDEEVIYADELDDQVEYVEERQPVASGVFARLRR